MRCVVGLPESCDDERKCGLCSDHVFSALGDIILIMFPFLGQLIPAAAPQSPEATGRRTTLVHAAAVWFPGDQPKVDPCDWPQHKCVSRKKAAWREAAQIRATQVSFSPKSKPPSRDPDTSMASKANEKAR